jgi:dihydrofolate reductase
LGSHPKAYHACQAAQTTSRPVRWEEVKEDRHMRRLMVSEFITLDGVVEAPGGEPGHPHTGWVFDYHGPELERYKLEEIRNAGSMLLGRVTYEGFAEAWPPRTGEIADRLNSMPKHVVSSTLTMPLAWSNSTLLTGDLATAVAELKQGDGGLILVHGSATLAQGLLAAGLVDDLRLMIFPVLVGGGSGIFPGSFEKSTFTLVESETVLPNVVALTYSRMA